MKVQRTQAATLVDLAARIALMTTGKVHLYQDDGFVPDENSTLADLNAHEATYTGYTPGGVALAGPLGPYADGENQYAENYPTILFQPTGPVLISNNIRGAYFETAAGGNLDSYWIFDSPVAMNSVLDQILLDSKFIYQNPQITQPDPA